MAVGTQGFVENVKSLILFRRTAETVPRTEEMWVVQEVVNTLWPKNGRKKGF